MRVIKLFLIILIGAVSCKKDKEQEYVPILKNGYYYFVSFETPSRRQATIYYLYRDNFYAARFYPDSICSSRIAGYVTQNDSLIEIPFLHYYSKSNICSYWNDGRPSKSFIYYIKDLHDFKTKDYPQLDGVFYMFNSTDTINPYRESYFQLKWYRD
jgi:hypothetical protein